jgi:hypothetical protein
MRNKDISLAMRKYAMICCRSVDFSAGKVLIVLVDVESRPVATQFYCSIAMDFP